MSGGLADISDADLMRMLSAARAGGGPSSGSAPATPPARLAAPSPIEGSDPAALSFRVRPNNVAGAAPVEIPAPAVDLSHLSDDDLMRQLAAARKPAAPVPVSRDDFEGRIRGDGSDRQIMASDTREQDTPLGRGLRAQADERLVGPPSAGNTLAAGLLRMSNAAGLNIPRNAGAAIASLPGVGNGRSFDENYRLAKDQEEALARQAPITAGAGTVAGIGLGAFGLPPIGNVAKLGRVGQAAVTGAGYGFAGEALDSKDLGQAAGAGFAGGILGGSLGYGIDKLAPIVAPVVSRLIGRGVPFRGADGSMTPEAVAALREAGVDPAQMPPQLTAQIERAFATKGSSPAVAREAMAGEFGIPLSRAQAALDPRAASLEQGALGGTRGSRAQEIGRDFTARQGSAIDAARGDLQGMAARGAPILDNPAAAAEGIADRARRATADHTFDVAAAQRLEDEARRAARGGGSGDALDAAAVAQARIREAAGQSREAYRGAYQAAAGIEGEFRPGAFGKVGERARADLGPGFPVDPVVTPQAARALADLDNLPQLLAKPDGAGPTAADAETIRRRLLAYRSATDPRNPTDRAAVDSLIRTYTGHVENAEAAGLFGPRQAPRTAAEAGDGFPGAASLDAPAAPLPAAGGTPARGGEPESLTRFLARTGGIPLDAEARAGDLHRAYIPGQGTLARNGAPTWDQIRVRLAEESFLPPGMDGAASANDVADWARNAIRAERVEGRPTVRMGDEAGVGARRAADAVAEQNADHAIMVDRQARRMAIDLEGYGVGPRDLDRGALNHAAEQVVLGRHAGDTVEAYEAALAREGGSTPRGAPSADAVPFDGPTAVPASDALPGGSTELGTALRNARGLFRQHVQAFKPRGPGDDAGQLMAKIVERDPTPAELASWMFGSATRPGERGLSVRFASRLREALGAESPALGAVQQGLIAHALDGNGTGDVGRRLDVLLRHEGRAAANIILTPEQRGALGAFRAALYETERRRQALPDWLTNLARKDFDPNAVTADLFGSGVPGARTGSASYARALKGFLGEDSAEWSGVRQAAISRLLRPEGRDLSPVQEADRIRAFVQGDGAKFAEHLFDGEERNRLMRYGAALRSTVLPSGLAAPDNGRRQMAAHLLNGLLGVLAFKAGAPAAAAAPFTAKVGQRVAIGGPSAFMASRSFSGGAPRAVAPLPLAPLGQLGVGSGLAAAQR